MIHIVTEDPDGGGKVTCEFRGGVCIITDAARGQVVLAIDELVKITALAQREAGRASGE